MLIFAQASWGEVVELWLDETSSGGGGGVSFRVVKYTVPEEIIILNE